MGFIGVSRIIRVIRIIRAIRSISVVSVISVIGLIGIIMVIISKVIRSIRCTHTYVHTYLGVGVDTRASHINLVLGLLWLLGLLELLGLLCHSVRSSYHMLSHYLCCWSTVHIYNQIERQIEPSPPMLGLRGSGGWTLCMNIIQQKSDIRNK